MSDAGLTGNFLRQGAIFYYQHFPVCGRMTLFAELLKLAPGPAGNRAGRRMFKQKHRLTVTFFQQFLKIIPGPAGVSRMHRFRICFGLLRTSKKAQVL